MLIVTFELFADCQYTVIVSELIEVIRLSRFHRKLLNAVPDGMVTVSVNGSLGEAPEGSVHEFPDKLVSVT